MYVLVIVVVLLVLDQRYLTAIACLLAVFGLQVLLY